jgi:hypothetical protein
MRLTAFDGYRAVLVAVIVSFDVAVPMLVVGVGI